jgi:hypothetical protein
MKNAESRMQSKRGGELPQPGKPPRILAVSEKREASWSAPALWRFQMATGMAVRICLGGCVEQNKTNSPKPMQASKPLICGLDEFGLSIGQLCSLGSVRIKLYVSLRHINELSLFKLQPKRRIEKMRSHYELLFSRVKKNWSDGTLKISWIRQQPRGFTASIEAGQVSHLLRMPEIGGLFLEDVPGRKRINVKPKERWFAVKARFAIQIEGQTAGLQSYEDRIVIVKACSFEDAENKLQPQFKQYSAPYLNPHGFMARWAYERILDCYEIGDEEIDARGTEFFSVLARRRMMPKYAWKTSRKQ